MAVHQTELMRQPGKPRRETDRRTRLGWLRLRVVHDLERDVQLEKIRSFDLAHAAKIEVIVMALEAERQKSVDDNALSRGHEHVCSPQSERGE